MKVYEIKVQVVATFNVAAYDYQQAFQDVKSQLYVECDAALDGIGQRTQLIEAFATNKTWDELTFTEVDLDNVPF